MGEDNQNGSTTPSSEGDGLIIAPIQVIIPGAMLSEDDSDYEDESRPKRKVLRKKRSSKEEQAEIAAEEQKLAKTMLLTKTIGQALRLINEQKVRAKSGKNSSFLAIDFLNSFFTGERKEKEEGRRNPTNGFGAKSSTSQLWPSSGHYSLLRRRDQEKNGRVQFICDQLKQDQTFAVSTSYYTHNLTTIFRVFEYLSLYFKECT